MPIQPQDVPVRLKGTSQKSPSNLSMPGEMTDAVNVQILKGNGSGVELSKRYGTQSLSAATNTPGITSTNTRHMVTLGASLAMDNDQAIMARDAGLGEWVTYSRNNFNFTSRTGVISESLFQKTTPAYAYDANSGNELIAWYDQADGIRYSVRGRTLGDWTAHETQVAGWVAFNAAYKVQAFAPGNGYFYVFGPRVAGSALGILRINVYNPSEPPVTYTVSADPTTSPWDVQLTPEGKFIIAVRNTSAVTTLIAIWDPALAALIYSSTIATIALRNASWVSQNPFGSGSLRRYYLATSDATNGIQVWTFDQFAALADAVYTDDGTIHFSGANITGWYQQGTGVVLFVDNPSAGNFYIYKAGAFWMFNLSFASKAFLSGGTWYALGRYDSALQPTLFLVDLAGKRVVGKVDIEGGQWTNYLNTAGTIPWVSQIGTQFVCPVMAAHIAMNQSNSVPIGTQIQGVSLVTFDNAGATSRPVELGGVLHFPGSIPWIFDGAQAVESGFNVFPEQLAIADAGSGTSKISGVLLSYRATYVWRDAVGNVYESAPSPIQSFTTSTIHDVNVTVLCLRSTLRTDVMINVYGNDPTQPTVYRLINSAPAQNSLTTNPPQVTVLDSLSRLATNPDWATRALLYTGDGSNGNPVEHIPPPSCTIMWTAQNRVFVAGIDQDPSAVWFSNEVTPKEGASYFDGFRFRVVGAVTAGAGRDRNVVVFTIDSIWTVTGEFPDNAFGSFQIPTPFRLPHQIGAIDSNAVVVSSVGIFFQSLKGLHILGWDWSVQYIGSDVEDTLGLDALTSGIEVPELHQVRLYTARGNTLVWDTMFSLWTTFDGQPARAACNWQNVPCYIGSDGVVHQETPGAYGDDGGFIQSTLAFAIIAPADLRGYFCLFALQLLGETRGPHVLNATLGYNSQSFPTTQYEFPVTGTDIYGGVTYGVGIYGGSDDGVLKLEVRPKKRQAAAYQLTLWDSLLTSGPSAGFTLQAIVASIGVEPGLGRTQAAQRMTKL